MHYAGFFLFCFYYLNSWEWEVGKREVEVEWVEDHRGGSREWVALLLLERSLYKHVLQIAFASSSFQVNSFSLSLSLSVALPVA